MPRTATLEHVAEKKKILENAAGFQALRKQSWQGADGSGGGGSGGGGGGGWFNFSSRSTLLLCTFLANLNTKSSRWA